MIPVEFASAEYSVNVNNVIVNVSGMKAREPDLLSPPPQCDDGGSSPRKIYATMNLPLSGVF